MRRRVVVPRSEIVEDAETILGESLITRTRSEDQKTRRAAQMSILYHDNNWSLEKVGVAYNLSRERVRQVFVTYGMQTRAPLGSQHYNQPPDLSNLRRVRSNRGNVIVADSDLANDDIADDDRLMISGPQPVMSGMLPGESRD
jgi:hypothetical protein